MGKYVEQNLNKGEKVFKEAKFSKAPVIVKWVKAGICIVIFFVLLGIVNSYTETSNELEELENILSGESIEESAFELFLETFAEAISGFMLYIGILFFLPVISAITATIRYMNLELSITTKRVLGKTGVISTQAMDTPLDKINNVSASSGLFGKIFHYGKVSISDGGLSSITFDYIENPDDFKRTLMQQIEEYQETKIREQAERTASAMAGVMNQQAQQNQQ